jgi:hypothetical protein
MSVAVAVISREYEQAGAPNMARRIQYAEAILKLYGNGAPDNGPMAAAPVDSAPSGGSGGTGSTGNACNGQGDNFTGVPNQTVPKGKGFSLADNTDYSSTPCAPGSTESNIYVHPVRHFKIRLCKIGNTGTIVASIVSDKVVAMYKAAAGAGIALNGGGFRTYEEQFKARTNNHCSVPAGPSNAGCSPPTAVPGNSQHERGLAIDVSLGGTIRRGSPAFNWLTANAAQYGYYNLPSESWHWSTSGN